MIKFDYKKLSISLFIILVLVIIFYSIFYENKKNVILKEEVERKIDSLNRENKILKKDIKYRDYKIDSISKSKFEKYNDISIIEDKIKVIDNKLSKYINQNNKNNELIKKYKDSILNIKYINKEGDVLLESIKNNLRKNEK